MTEVATKRVVRQTARHEYVPLEKMRVRHSVAQREHIQAWEDHLFKVFSLEKFDTPAVNKVGEWYWIIDGQHSVGALKRWLGDWKGQQIECLVYKNLSEKQEADIFLSLNETRNVNAFAKFKVGLTAEREEETNIKAIVDLKRLKISQQKDEGTIGCVGTLRRIYRLGADCLARDLEITHQAFGDEGLDRDILEGIGVLVSRYNGRIDDKRTIRALANLRGGANALRSRGERLRQQTGSPRSHCIAAAAVEAYNRQKGGKKLPTWWKLETA